MTAIIRARPKIAAKIEPTIIEVVFLSAVELFKATVGDALPGVVGPNDSTRLASERTAVIEPARTVGWETIPDDEDDVGTEFDE
jgi:hypothetical protein